GRYLASAWKRDLDVALAFQNFLCGDDDAGTPMNSARPRAAAGVDRDGCGGYPLNQMSGVVGKRDQGTFGLGHGKTSRCVHVGPIARRRERSLLATWPGPA